MNEPIFNSVHHLNWPYTIAIRQLWLPPGVSNCMAFIFNLDVDSTCQFAIQYSGGEVLKTLVCQGCGLLSHISD